MFDFGSRCQHHRHQHQVQHQNHQYRLDRRDQPNIAAKKSQVTNRLVVGNYFDEHKVSESYFKKMPREKHTEILILQEQNNRTE